MDAQRARDAAAGRAVATGRPRGRRALTRGITGLVLAGGRGRRMGEVDKGLQPFRGKALVEHVLDRLAPQVGSVIVSANRHLDRYAAFGQRVVTDTIAIDAGPLAGLHAGLVACTTDLLAAVPCDAPLFPTDLVVRLAEALADEAVDVATVRTDVRTHPVFCLLRVTAIDGLASYVDGGGRSVNGWIATTRHREVSFDDEAAFRNLNTIDDLRDAERDG